MKKFKEIVRSYKDGTYEYNGKWYNNVTNAGRVIKQNGDGCYYFYCDSVNQEQLEKYCEEHNLGFEITVVKSKRMNVFGTKERVVVEMWSIA